MLLTQDQNMSKPNNSWQHDAFVSKYLKTHTKNNEMHATTNAFVKNSKENNILMLNTVYANC